MSVPDLLHVTTEPLEDAVVVRATGEIDMSTVDVLKRELDAARAEAPTALLDLSGVTFSTRTVSICCSMRATVPPSATGASS